MMFLMLITLPSWATETIKISEDMRTLAEKASQVHITPAMLERIKQTVAKINSEPYKKDMAAMQAAAARLVDIENNPHVNEAMQQAIDNGVIQGDWVYVFISSSMPTATIQNYIRQVAKIGNGVLVMRGFIGGAHRVKPTAKYIAQRLRKDPFCDHPKCAMYPVEIQIDPILFKKHGITKVPAVTFVENVHFDGYCAQRTEDFLAQAHATVVYGDVSLHYALQQLYEQQPSPSLLATLEHLEPKIK